MTKTSQDITDAVHDYFDRGLHAVQPFAAGDGFLDIAIQDVYEDIASVKVTTRSYHEYLHLVRSGSRWQIANALWRVR
jgi:hypothetical protein